MRHFIALGPGAGSGWGSTEEEAVANMHKGGVRPDERYETFEVHPKTKIDDVGIMKWPKGHPPISLGVTNPKSRVSAAIKAAAMSPVIRTAAKELGVPTLDFRGPAKQKSKPKVRVTEAEYERIQKRAAEMKAIRERINTSHSARALLRRVLPVLQITAVERKFPAGLKSLIADIKKELGE